MGLASISSKILLLFALFLATPISVYGDSTRIIGFCSESYPSRSIDCNWPKYFSILGVVSGLGWGAALIFFTVIAWPTYYLARYCCKCCGSNERRVGCCCTEKIRPVYSVGAIIFSKCMIGFVFLMASGGLAIGFVGNDWIQTSWDRTFSAAVFLDNYQSAVAYQVGSTLSSVNSAVIPIAQRNGLTSLYSGVASTTDISTFRTSVITTMLSQLRDALPNAASFQNSIIQDFRNGLQDTANWVSRCKSALQPIEDARRIVLMTGLIIPVGFLFLGIIPALFNIRLYMPMIIVFFLFPVAGLAWLNFAIHGTGWFLMDDINYAVGQIQKGDYPFFADAVGCDQYSFINLTYVNSSNLLRQATCSFLSQSLLCRNTTQGVGATTVYIDPFQCSNTAAFQATCNSYSPAQVLGIRTTSGYTGTVPAQPEYSSLCANGLDSSGKCTISQCSTSCKNATIGISIGTNTVVYCDAASNCNGVFAVSSLPTLLGLASDVTALENLLAQLLAVYTQWVLPNMSCNAIINSFLYPFADPCGKARDGFLLVMIGACIEAGAVTFGICVLSVGQKRWFNYDDIKNKKWVAAFDQNDLDPQTYVPPPHQGEFPEPVKGQPTPCPTPMQTVVSPVLSPVHSPVHSPMHHPAAAPYAQPRSPGLPPTFMAPSYGQQLPPDLMYQQNPYYQNPYDI